MRQADYAEIQAYSGIFGIAISILAAFFTWKAAIAARDAASSSKYSAEIANAALVKLERAFVYGSINPDGVVESPAKDRLFIPITFTNTGRTETKYAMTRWSWIAFNGDMPSDFSFPDIGDAAARKTFIAPNSSIFVGPAIIEQSVLENSVAGHRVIYIWAWVEYDDIFDGTKRHRTEYCARVRFHDASKSEQGKKVAAATFIFHDRFNGTDEDCTNPVQTGSPKNPLPA